MGLRLTIAILMSDIDGEWTLNASLTRLSSYRKCLRRRTLDHSAQPTSLLQIEGTTRCSHTARGFDFGSSSGFAADLKLKAGFGFRASATFPDLENRCPRSRSHRNRNLFRSRGCGTKPSKTTTAMTADHKGMQRKYSRGHTAAR